MRAERAAVEMEGVEIIVMSVVRVTCSDKNGSELYIVRYAGQFVVSSHYILKFPLGIISNVWLWCHILLPRQTHDEQN